MDPASRNLLASLVRNSRVASLGTLHDGAPFVSMVLAAPGPGFSEWFIHVSRLSAHTQDLQDPRASLMLAMPDEPDKDPQQLARLTLCWARRPSSAARQGASARETYVAKFPQMAEIVGQLGDFLSGRSGRARDSWATSRARSR
jgi:putative heme iron utilization protein